MDSLRVVKELTREDIERAIQAAYTEKDADWLKLYHLASGEIDGL